MRAMLYVMTFLTVIGAAFWAYHENYKTQDALSEAQAVRADIRDARARLAVLKAEWAYLNRPDRLRALAEINFDSLGLLEIRPHQFGRVREVAMPVEDILIIEDPIDVIEYLSEGGHFP